MKLVNFTQRIIISIITGPLPPIYFRIMDKTEAQMTITVTFKWDSPRGLGPEVVVEYYKITVATPKSLPTTYTVYSLSWKVPLNYNTQYTISIVSVNCLGESYQVTRHLEFSMLTI